MTEPCVSELLINNVYWLFGASGSCTFIIATPK